MSDKRVPIKTPEERGIAEANLMLAQLRIRRAELRLGAEPTLARYNQLRDRMTEKEAALVAVMICRHWKRVVR